jgi:hypothetical protein
VTEQVERQRDHYANGLHGSPCGHQKAAVQR